MALVRTTLLRKDAATLLDLAAGLVPEASLQQLTSVLAKQARTIVPVELCDVLVVDANTDAYFVMQVRTRARLRCCRMLITCGVSCCVRCAHVHRAVLYCGW